MAKWKKLQFEETEEVYKCPKHPDMTGKVYRIKGNEKKDLPIICLFCGEKAGLIKIDVGL